MISWFQLWIFFKVWSVKTTQATESASIMTDANLSVNTDSQKTRRLSEQSYFLSGWTLQSEAGAVMLRTRLTSQLLHLYVVLLTFISISKLTVLQMAPFKGAFCNDPLLHVTKLHQQGAVFYWQLCWDVFRRVLLFVVFGGFFKPPRPLDSRRPSL